MFDTNGKKKGGVREVGEGGGGGGREGDVRWRSGCLQQEVGMLKGYGGRALRFKGWGGVSAVRPRCSLHGNERTCRFGEANIANEREGAASSVPS